MRRRLLARPPFGRTVRLIGAVGRAEGLVLTRTGLVIAGGGGRWLHSLLRRWRLLLRGWCRGCRLWWRRRLGGRFSGRLRARHHVRRRRHEMLPYRRRQRTA